MEPGEEHAAGRGRRRGQAGRKLGKRLQLLSGGERALVAIAFLMALVLARPCPFYILDEIEAALDDVNIGRLVQLLRDYRERTQFIIITHQKRTMEAADVLYGVTMGPDGASQVVSARMAEEEIDREERARTEARPGRGPELNRRRPSAAGRLESDPGGVARGVQGRRRGGGPGGGAGRGGAGAQGALRPPAP